MTNSRDEKLDELLAKLPAAAPSEALLARIKSIPEDHDQPLGLRSFWPFERVAVPVLAMAAAALLGLFAENWFEMPGFDESTLVNSNAELVGGRADGAEGYDELAALAFSQEFAFVHDTEGY